MAKRRDISDTLNFALTVMSYIKLRTEVTAQDIHNQLQHTDTPRDLRSVQRMLKTLATAYPQLEVRKDTKPFGYKWRENAPRIVLPRMDEYQALLLAMSQQHLSNYLPKSMQESMASLFLEANAVLNQRNADKSAKDWLQKVRFGASTFQLIPPEIDEDIFKTVTDCLFNDSEMALTYRRRDGEQREYITHNYGLFTRASVIFLVAYSVNSSRKENSLQLRTFLVHRMLAARELSFHFERDKSFDLDQYVHEGRHLYGSGERVQLSFEIKRDIGSHLEEERMAEDQVIEEIDDHWMRISATVHKSMELDQFLNGYGDAVRNVSTNPSILPR